MINNSNKVFKLGFALIPTLFLGLVLTVGLSGCGFFDNNSTPVPKANATGYYEGTASVLEEDNSTVLEINDLKAFVNGDQILIMSVSNVLLYELKGISITNNDYTATVNIYKDGTFLTTTTVVGVITEGASFTGTFAGSGAGNGSFDVAYSSVNDTDADLSVITTFWRGSFNGGFVSDYIIDLNGQMIPDTLPDGSNLTGCSITGLFVPVENQNLYTINNMVLSNCNDTNINDTNYTGMATTITLGNPLESNVIMPIAFSNGSYSGTGEIPIDN